MTLEAFGMAALRWFAVWFQLFVVYAAFAVPYRLSRDTGPRITHMIGVLVVALLAARWAYSDLHRTTQPAKDDAAVLSFQFIPTERRQADAIFVFGLIVIPAVYGFGKGYERYRNTTPGTMPRRAIRLRGLHDD